MDYTTICKGRLIVVPGAIHLTPKLLPFKGGGTFANGTLTRPAALLPPSRKW